MTIDLTADAKRLLDRAIIHLDKDFQNVPWDFIDFVIDKQGNLMEGSQYTITCVARGDDGTVRVTQQPKALLDGTADWFMSVLRSEGLPDDDGNFGYKLV